MSGLAKKKKAFDRESQRSFLAMCFG